MIPKQILSRNIKRAFLYSSLALEMGLWVLVCYVIGSYLDRKLGSEPWLLIVFSLIGIYGGMRSIIKAAIKMQKSIEEKKDS
jgi:ATP synthase protein I